MFQESKIKLNSILSTETDTVSLNTNYLTISKVIASKCLSKGELKAGDSAAAIMNMANRYTDTLGDMTIIDRGRFKSIFTTSIKSSINFNTDLRATRNLSELLGSDIGEVDYTKDVSQLVRLVLIVLFQGE